MGGEDLWNCYEMSWLSECGRPEVRLMQMVYSADSPALVESKSLKLYLMRFNQERFSGEQEVLSTLKRDLQECLQTDEISIFLNELNSPALLELHPPRGDSLDTETDAEFDFQYVPDRLRCSKTVIEGAVYSNLLRSVCPLTGQPDYATIEIRYIGPEIDPGSLLGYLVGFRCHGDYHEHCAELIFRDLLEHCECESLAVRATYTRRGGIDISPVRWTIDASDWLPYRRLVRC
jgi:7-cyano-7-deazaguanine reductase